MDPTFSISTPSRHPANQKGYDAKHHRYRAEYVNPEFWTLVLDASPGLPKSANGDVRVPSEIVSFAWHIEQVNGAFNVQDRRTSPPNWKTEVKVPEPGAYKITLQINLADGTRKINTRRYQLRDFLIVGIGDSFASGQGNPDVSAVPSDDQKAMCKATTLALAIAKAEEMLKNFFRKLKEEFKDLIEDKIKEYIPFAGKIIVAELNAAGDVLELIKDGVEEIGDTVVETVKDVGRTIAEGVEEFGGWLGMGDGGESNEIKPQPARWQEPYAYRSYRSGQSLAARQVETESEFHADRVTFLSFARTGSEIDSGLLGPRTIDPNIFGDALSNLAIDDWAQNRGQIEEAKGSVRGRSIDALIISIGGNDLGFSSVVTDSLLFSKDAKRQELANKTREKIKKQLPHELDLLKRSIDTQLKPRQVFITEYPTGLFTKRDEDGRVKDGGPCGALSSTDIPGTSTGLDVDKEDGRVLRQLGKELNQALRAKADEFGWIFVDGIDHGFDGHGYCAHHSYFVSAEESCLNQGDFEGMLHPNKRGHGVIRDCIARALRRELFVAHESWLEPVLNVMMK
jgi:hypothetical protein